MGALLIILLLTVGLALRTGFFGNLGTARTPADTGLFDAGARTLVLVLLCLLGLLVLGAMDGNVLGTSVVDLAFVK